MTDTMDFMAIDVHTSRGRAYSQAFLRTTIDIRSSRVGKRVPMQHKRPTQEEYFGEVVREQCC